MSTGITVKAYLFPKDFHGKEEIRRFNFDVNVTNSFYALQEKLVTLFPNLQRVIFAVLYKDEEGDLITVSSDEELRTACNAPRSDNVLRLHIKKAEKGSIFQHRKREGSPLTETVAPNFVHPRVTCDGCEGPVIGFRYKCIQCPDYDLCVECEFKQLHAQHMLVRIPTPDLAHQIPCFGERHGGHRRHHMGHRRRHGGRFFSTVNKGPECDASDDAPSDQDKTHYPFQFNQVLEKIWTTLGGLPRDINNAPTNSTAAQANAENESNKNKVENQEEYLQKVGNQVAAMLDPLGIDVDYYVTKNTPEKEVAHESYSANSTVVLRDPENFKVTAPEQTAIVTAAEQAAPVTAAEQLTNKQIYPSLELEKSAEKNLEAGDGWMYIDVEAKEATFRSANEEEAQQPKSPGPPTTSIANEMNRLSLERVPPPPPAHPNPTIQSALEQMMSMGFSNEGGWLIQLLEVKNGNIDEVLETLSPIPSSRK